MNSALRWLASAPGCGHPARTRRPCPWALPRVRRRRNNIPGTSRSPRRSIRLDHFLQPIEDVVVVRCPTCMRTRAVRPNRVASAALGPVPREPSLLRGARNLPRGRSKNCKGRTSQDFVPRSDHDCSRDGPETGKRTRRPSTQVEAEPSHSALARESPQ